jgi:TolB-like protein/DNA-binding winged helix-turn-helix (wHTH) protein
MLAGVRRFEDFELDSDAFRLTRDGQIVRLERIPLALLCLLVERRGQTVTRDDILERISGKGVFIDSENAINTAIRKIRRALNDDVDAPRFVVTIPGKGYRFIAPVTVANGELQDIVNDEPMSNGAASEPADAAAPLETTSGTASPESDRSNSRLTLLLFPGSLMLVAGVVATASLVLVPHLWRKEPHTFATIPLQESSCRAMPGMPSIAVLPFNNLSGDPQQDYFSDGISNQLIEDLSRLPGLLVIARNSSFAYKGKSLEEREIGRELRVKYILEGNIRKAAERIRIGVELVDAGSATEMWARRFDRPVKDIFALQGRDCDQGGDHTRASAAAGSNQGSDFPQFSNDR